ncbi:MAG: hypothetical protein DRJ29_06560 [Bacteroidetes bacterium]|nr:MAG: hypothetical protein DRJ13_15925 [Bacteroidota bacterium]RLD94209.1 MAG: hypothetical protein DRJ29_06560 [Bacteroidota bacterium]
MNKLIIITILVFVLNIPFGYWRANVKRFSTQWFLAIHIPVPFIVAMRILGDVGFSWHTYVFLVGGFFLGQKLGSMLMKRVHNHCQQESSCLVMDLLRCIKA